MAGAGRRRIQRACVSPPPQPAPGVEHFRSGAAHFETSFLSFGVAESASQRLLIGRNEQVQTDTLIDK